MNSLALSPSDSAAKYGIYTLLDAHQDDLSQKFCGEGIPDWAVDVGCKKNLQMIMHIVCMYTDHIHTSDHYVLFSL